MKLEKSVAHEAGRMQSLDQFRGYTVAGMFLVNFLGMFAAVHGIFKHHEIYCSYADTIMPQFFFAVGYAYRLTMVKAVERQGMQAYKHAIRRNLTLIIIGEIIYGLNPMDLYRMMMGGDVLGLLQYPFRAHAFQALTHIGVTGLWVLPVIARSARVRCLFLIGSVMLHFLLSKLFWYDYLWANGAIDGGQLGFLSWTIPTLIGSFAFDWVKGRGPQGALRVLVAWSLFFMVLGYGLSCVTAINHAATGGSGIARWFVEPPFFPPSLPTDIWAMSQKAGSASYLFFGAGFSLLVYALFVRISDLGTFRWGVFRTFGQNALVAYILGGIIQGIIQLPMSGDAPLPLALAGFCLMFSLAFGVMRLMEKRQIHIRL